MSNFLNNITQFLEKHPFLDMSLKVGVVYLILMVTLYFHMIFENGEVVDIIYLYIKPK